MRPSGRDAIEAYGHADTPSSATVTPFQKNVHSLDNLAQGQITRSLPQGEGAHFFETVFLRNPLERPKGSRLRRLNPRPLPAWRGVGRRIGSSGEGVVNVDNTGIMLLMMTT